MTRKTLLSLLLVAVMLLSGCSLVVKDANVDALQTIIDVNGDIVNKGTLLNAYEQNLYMEQYYAQIAAMYMGQQEDVDPAQTLENTIATYITSLVKNQKCKELGFDQFTDEEMAALEAQADADYQEQLENVKSTYFSGSELGEEALAAEVEKYAADMGYTPENMLINAKGAEMAKRLEAYVTDPVTIDDADLQAALDAKITSEQASYATDYAAYGRKVNTGGTAYFTPAGYRTVLVFETVKPVDEPGDAPAEDEAATDETAETEPVETEPAVIDEAKIAIDAVYEQLLAGAAFTEVIADYDTYALCETSDDIDAAVVAAAMALPKAGMYTAVVETASGYAIACYKGDVPEHTATLDEVRDQIYDETLTSKKDAAYDAAVAQWENAADVKIYRERLSN